MQGLRILTDEVSLKKTFQRSITPSVPRDADTSDIEDDIDMDSDSDSLFDSNSLFDEPMLESPDDFLRTAETIPLTYEEPPRPSDLTPARRTVPPIRGLYFDPFVLLPEDLAESLLQKCMDTYFRDEDVNQVMLFERVVPDSVALLQPGASLPDFLNDLLKTMASTLRATLPSKTHELLFPAPDAPPCARQVIINFYKPGEGITPHVDLLDRFGDGIIGVSLGSGCVMRFTDTNVKHDEENGLAKDGGEQATWDVFLPHGSIYVMSEEARYGWTHGIHGRKEDWVQGSVTSDADHWVMRSIRVSITFRWLLPGADVVGGLAEPQSQY